MQFLLSFAWRDLRAGGRNLWVFCICLALGVTLITATGGLYQQVRSALLADTRALMGGDLEVDSVAPLPQQAVSWIKENGTVSLLTELDTMMLTEGGELQLVELQSVDKLYPLYGSLELDPPDPLDKVTGFQQGQWGIALDPLLAERLNIAMGDQVTIGNLTLAVRALIRSQPDRSLRADWIDTRRWNLSRIVWSDNDNQEYPIFLKGFRSIENAAIRPRKVRILAVLTVRNST